jgi:hypothetical protein
MLGVALLLAGLSGAPDVLAQQTFWQNVSLGDWQFDDRGSVDQPKRFYGATLP